MPSATSGDNRPQNAQFTGFGIRTSAHTHIDRIHLGRLGCGSPVHVLYPLWNPALAYTVASFFSGIGGLDLGLERAGFDVRFQCEVKPFCCDILRQHWPNLPLDHDIRKLDDAKIPKADVWAAGFPCQDLSLARMGPRSGLRGIQSGLFHDFMRLVRGGRPKAIILENVHGLLSSHGGRDFTIVLKALDELGYGVAWRGVCLTARTSESPSSAAASTLLPCIETQEVPDKYFLSPNAAIGILRRTDRMERNLPPSFRRSLEILQKVRS